MMKQLSTTLLLRFLLLLCHAQNQKKIVERDMKEAYIHDFKLCYFKKFLVYGLNNSAAINAVMAADPAFCYLHNSQATHDGLYNQLFSSMPSYINAQKTNSFICTTCY